MCFGHIDIQWMPSGRTFEEKMTESIILVSYTISPPKSPWSGIQPANTIIDGISFTKSLNNVICFDKNRKFSQSGAAISLGKNIVTFVTQSRKNIVKFVNRSLIKIAHFVNHSQQKSQMLSRFVTR